MKLKLVWGWKKKPNLLKVETKCPNLKELTIIDYHDVAMLVHRVQSLPKLESLQIFGARNKELVINHDCIHTLVLGRSNMVTVWMVVPSLFCLRISQSSVKKMMVESAHSVSVVSVLGSCELGETEKKVFKSGKVLRLRISVHKGVLQVTQGKQTFKFGRL